jgi:hypothetical protein
MTLIGSHCNATITLPDGSYSFSANISNSTNLSINATSETRYVIIDTTLPNNLQFETPTSNITQYYAPTLVFNLTFNETNLAFCTLQVNGTNYTMNNVSSGKCQAAPVLPPSNYTYLGFVKDLANHTNVTANFTLYTFNVTNTTANYSDPESDFAQDLHILLVNTSNYMGNISALIQYNGVNYTAVLNTSINGHYVFYYLITPPFVSAPTTINVNWTYFFLNSSAPTYPYTLNYSLTVVPLNITDCNIDAGTVVLANFSFFDQASATTVTNSTMDATFFLKNSVSSTSKNFSFNWTTPVPSIALCVNASAGNYWLDSIQQFRATGYRNLFYYLLNQSINIPIRVNVSLYNLQTNLSTATQYAVFGIANTPIQNAYVQIYRYYPATNQLLLVSMGKTDLNGIAESYAIPNDVIYRYIVVEDYAITYISGTATLPCDPYATLCKVSIYTTADVQNEYMGYILSNLAGCRFDNVTDNVICSSNNPSGTGTDLRLRLWLVNGTNNNLICDNIIHTGSGTVICHVPDRNQTYVYVGTQTIGSIVITGSGVISPITSATKYDLGLGILAALVLIFALAAVGLPAGLSACLVLAMVGVTLSAMLNFIDVGVSALLGMWAITFLLGWVLRQ